MSETAGIKSILSVTNIATALTVSGLASQTAAYILATRFYREFGVTSDQVGLTPLSSIGRLHNSAFYIFLIALCLVVVVLSLVVLFDYLSTRRGKGTAFAKELTLKLSIIGCMTVVIGMATMTATYAQNVAHDAMEGVSKDDFLARSLKDDLSLNPVTVRWIKVDEYPFVLPDSERSSERKRTGSFLGVNAGQVFYYDRVANKTMIVPSSQVQLSVDPSPPIKQE